VLYKSCIQTIYTDPVAMRPYGGGVSVANKTLTDAAIGLILKYSYSGQLLRSQEGQKHDVQT
jgi:hypothetical protein